jgi:DNA-binding response OmpR family regulator
LVKPFSFEELHARLRAIHRRPNITKKPILIVGDIVLNQDTHIVTRDGQTVPFTRKEYAVIEYLMQHQGTLVSRVLMT